MNTEKTIIRVLQYRSSVSLCAAIILTTMLGIRIGFFHPVIILVALFTTVMLFLLIEAILRTAGINAAKKFIVHNAVSDTIVVIDFYFQLQSMKELGPSTKRSLSGLVVSKIPTARWQKGRVVFTKDVKEQYEPALHQAVA